MGEASEFLASMRIREVFFYSQGGRLFWQGPSQLSADDLARAKGLKAELLSRVSDEALETLCAGADPEEAEYLRQERASIMEIEGGLCRVEAELRAGPLML